MKAKKNLSIEDTLLKKAEDRAKELNLNFAAYIITLINKDLGISTTSDEYIQVIRKPDNMYRGLDANALNAADQIMNMG